jgi:hypothetical protein
MDARALLRPSRRLGRAVAALVVVALLGWLVVAPSHLHVPAAAAAHTVDSHAASHDAPTGGGERAHPCQFCLSLERGGATSSPPAIVLALAPHAYELAPPDPPVAELSVPAVYRSRAPPHA